uniref:Uncharacterized protein n=1 Tax=Anguilla anguilla TaxID=7936 RepID=A0A0E9X9D6_ANGAN
MGKKISSINILQTSVLMFRRLHIYIGLTANGRQRWRLLVARPGQCSE